MKEGDLILVSAEATGLGKPMEAVIDKIETFMEQTLAHFLQLPAGRAYRDHIELRIVPA